MDDKVVSGDGMKRRLPLWMLGDHALNKSETASSNSRDDDDDKGSRADEERVTKCRRRPKWKSCEIGNDNDGLELEEKSTGVLRRCRVRKQTRRETISHDVDMDSEVAINQKKRKGRAKKSLEVDSNTDDLEGCVENREDEDLTMEDLMSIAKEFVQDDEVAQPVVSLKHEHRDEDAHSQHIQCGSSIRVPQGNTRSFQDRGTSSSSIAVENLTGEGPTCKPTMSGNPTQDMLDLFLGPLLKKTQEQEKDGVPLAEEINFTREVKKQAYSVVLGEEEPPVVMKKKTSLKDKVAMFLD
ncbi:uncharacterized protein LOC113783486 [Coffea eugenioides]|uniref:Uncharacterized protein n=2 Tax=Coffea TaxID=13442 RepID=A0A6P6UC40_COFAR|nr:uncharacterized protein LOC113709447 [Coffea arabica]XP_027185436.1 uncharacterized protein LOC113783486 [Coffea eugenioides]